MSPRMSSDWQGLVERLTGENLKIKALSNEFRRLVLGLLYTEGPMFQSDILQHVKIKSNLLAYHLDMLTKADMVERKYTERKGQNFSLYSIKTEGEKFLELIGAKPKLKGLKNERKKPINKGLRIHKMGRGKAVSFPATPRDAIAAEEERTVLPY